MTRDEAERERDRLAADQPDVTWLLHEPSPGQWSVARVGLKPADGASGSAQEAAPKPEADDPRHPSQRSVPPWSAAF